MESEWQRDMDDNKEFLSLLKTNLDLFAEALVRDSHTVAPVSVHLNGEYGLQDLCLSIPTVLGKNGAEQILEINFNEEEKRKLWHSAEELKKILARI